MHDKVYNRRVAPPPALEMDTQDARVTFIRSIAKLKLLKFDAHSLYFERASYFAKFSEPIEYRIFCSHFVKLYSSPVLVNSL